MPEMPPPVPVPPPAPPIPTQSNTPWYLDKAIYVAVLGAVLPFISGFLGIQLDPMKVAGIVVPLVAFIIAHKAKSAVVLVAEIRARAMQAVAASLPPPTTPQRAADALTGLMAPK